MRYSGFLTMLSAWGLMVMGFSLAGGLFFLSSLKELVNEEGRYPAGQA